MCYILLVVLDWAELRKDLLRYPLHCLGFHSTAILPVMKPAAVYEIKQVNSLSAGLLVLTKRSGWCLVDWREASSARIERAWSQLSLCLWPAWHL